MCWCRKKYKVSGETPGTGFDPLGRRLAVSGRHVGLSLNAAETPSELGEGNRQSQRSVPPLPNHKACAPTIMASFC